MPYFYTTIENQLREDGSFGLLYDHFDNVDNALAKLYNILAAAAVSGIPYHSGHIYRSDGLLIEGRVFDRRQQFAEAAEAQENAQEDVVEEETEAAEE